MVDLPLESASARLAGFHIDPVAYTVVTNGRTIRLTAVEFRVLYDLMSHVGQVRSRHDILTALWGPVVLAAKATNTAVVYIRRLRRKIEAVPDHPKHIITVRHKGYLFRP